MLEYDASVEFEQSVLGGVILPSTLKLSVDYVVDI